VSRGWLGGQRPKERGGRKGVAAADWGREGAEAASWGREEAAAGQGLGDGRGRERV
jgi:hypothetical protein